MENNMTIQEYLALPFSKQVCLALDDLKRVMGDPRYRIDMKDWHLPESVTGVDWPTRKCSVCMAGAKLTEWLDPTVKYGRRAVKEAVPSLTENKVDRFFGLISRIDDFRILVENRNRKSFKKDPQAFFDTAERMIDEMEASRPWYAL